jgi:hypothetical protein
MVWLLFRLEIWMKSVKLSQTETDIDEPPCRDCDFPEGMWW